MGPINSTNPQPIDTYQDRIDRKVPFFCDTNGDFIIESEHLLSGSHGATFINGEKKTAQ